MTWATRFRLRESLLESLWVIPLAGAVLGGILGLVVSFADEHIEAPSLWQYSPSTASTVLSSIIGATAALTGFVVTVTVLVVQMATGTFSARILRLWYRDRMLKATLAVLVGTLTFSFSVLRRIEDDFVPVLGVTLSGFLVSLCLLAFIVFFDRYLRRLRPAAVAADVASEARSMFEQTVRFADRTDIRWHYGTARADPSLVVRASRGGAIQAVDLDGLVEWARARGAELVLAHLVGDFVHTGGVLARVYGGELGDRAGEELEGMIALGDERTFEQDPAFALRIMVDMANRALSPAVNDPTTATQVLDHIGEVLGTHREDGSRGAYEAVQRRHAGRGRHGGQPLGGLRDARIHRDPRVRLNVGAGHATTPSTARGAARDRTARAPSSARGRAPPSGCHRRRRLARLGRPRSCERGRRPGDRCSGARLDEHVTCVRHPWVSGERAATAAHFAFLDWV